MSTNTENKYDSVTQEDVEVRVIEEPICYCPLCIFVANVMALFRPIISAFFTAPLHSLPGKIIKRETIITHHFSENPQHQ